MKLHNYFCMILSLRRVGFVNQSETNRRNQIPNQYLLVMTKNLVSTKAVSKPLQNWFCRINSVDHFGDSLYVHHS